MQRRFSKSVAAVCSTLILLLSLGQLSTAQDGPTQQDSPAQLAALVRNKWEMIELETAAANEEWTGSYRASDGPIVSTTLAWSPVSGFIVWWENCSKPVSRVNHGGAVLNNGSLKLTPEVSQNVPGSFTIPVEFIPVKWDAQHFLVPPNQLMKFIYAVNSRSVSELETFLLKVDDYDKNRRGLPAVPPGYAKYLRMKPINAAISRLGPKTERRDPKVILNAGKRAGVIPEMKFYRSRRGEPFFVLEVTSVDEHTAEAAVVWISDENDKEIPLKAGWKFSSRAPKGREAYMP